MTLRRMIRKLRLKEGDILLVNRRIPIERVIEAGRSISMPVSSILIVQVDEKNDIRRLSFAELEKLYLEAKKNING